MFKGKRKRDARKRREKRLKERALQERRDNSWKRDKTDRSTSRGFDVFGGNIVFNLQAMFILGAFIGGTASVFLENDLFSINTLVLLLLGAVSIMMPDLDTNGKPEGTIAFTYKKYRWVFVFISLLLILGSIFEVDGVVRYIIIGISIVSFVVSRYVVQEKMLLVASLGVIISGILFVKLWVILLGVYLGFASIMGHRTYTHSLIGIIYFGVIAFLINYDYHIKGIFPVMTLAYMAHILLDTSLFKREGLRLLRPFSKMKF